MLLLLLLLLTLLLLLAAAAAAALLCRRAAAVWRVAQDPLKQLQLIMERPALGPGVCVCMWVGGRVL